MRQYKMEGVVTALSSISHNGGQSFGISSKLRREKRVLPSGDSEEVPIISGNSTRGILRRRGMLHMCKLLGYGQSEGFINAVEQTHLADEQEKQPSLDAAAKDAVRATGLTLPAFYFLFCGGALTDSGKSVDIAQVRHLRELIPLVGVFGGALGNNILPGKLKCGKMEPACAELMHLLPDSFKAKLEARGFRPQSIWEYLQEEMYTRKDEAKNEHLRPLIAAAERPQLKAKPATAMLSAGLFDRSTESDKATLVEQKEHKQQMMYYVETFAAGTLFSWEIVLDDVTDVEFEAFLTALAEFSKMPYIGGKSNVGLGKIAVDFGSWSKIDSRLSTASEAIALPLGANYTAHLQARGPEIRDYLGAMK